ncbi:UNVERIFIED_CONTAM: hypothetical protein Slati_4302200 [Sesamum latifolium]|uniref:Aminotransferase-like plant mobile domain-containing protein n=1 Tax=Sesamum latifolium TaxID=2727402 RepID=A0AAW2TEY2_9LAMI
MVRPKSTHNPLGDITTHKRWSTAEEALFEKLCIEENLKEEVYLAAYLACWLCTFVLPGKDANSIRPSTFKMESMMVNGRRVSLAIPVLTSIYEGLNIIASSSRPARTSPSFPVHFVYAWLASYFKTHYPIWQGLHGPKMTRFSGEGGAKPFKFIDNGDAKELDHDYFIAIRSSYLTLRQASLEEGLRYWCLYVLSKSSSKAWFPGLPTNTKKFYSEAYKTWWTKVHGTFLDDNIACLISPKPTKITIKRKKHEDEQVDGENNPPYAPVPSIVVKSNSQAVAVEASKGKVEASASRSPSADFVAQLEDEIQSVDASEESETSDSWTTTPPPFGMGLKGKQLPQPPAVFFYKFDITSVEESLNTFFVKVRAYDEARSLSSQKLSRSLHEQHLKEAKARLQDVQAKASEGASKVQSIMNELEHVEKKIVVLKGRRTSLCAALKEQKQLNHEVQAKVHEVEEDIATLDNTALLDDAIVEDSKTNLETLKEDLKSLKPFA